VAYLNKRDALGALFFLGFLSAVVFPVASFHPSSNPQLLGLRIQVDPSGNVTPSEVIVTAAVASLLAMVSPSASQRGRYNLVPSR